jgi:hypothetical protein
VANQPPPFQGRRPAAWGDGKFWEILGLLAEAVTTAQLTNKAAFIFVHRKEPANLPPNAG